MLRGINRQVICEEDADRWVFMMALKECKDVSGFKLHAFCLMPNHVHLLIEPAGEPLELIFKRLGAKYVGWFNRKYDRAGHLFQDRFRSENVEDNLYFMTVLRYILQNPMKAGMESQPGSYPWSSYLAYKKGIGSITDTQYAIDLFGSQEALIDYVLLGNEDTVMDEDQFDWRMKIEKAKEIMEQVSGCATVSDFQRLDRQIQKEYAVKIYLAGVSAYQIAKMTGMSKSTVERTVKKCLGESAGAVENTVLHEADGEYLWDDIVW
jgi:REP element-mobilizing transposase RayT